MPEVPRSCLLGLGAQRVTGPLYDEDRLYCPTCKEQPEYFLETLDGWVNEVASDGTVIRALGNGGRSKYECPECGMEAYWGWELKVRDYTSRAPDRSHLNREGERAPGLPPLSDPYICKSRRGGWFVRRLSAEL